MTPSLFTTFRKVEATYKSITIQTFALRKAICNTPYSVSKLVDFIETVRLFFFKRAQVELPNNGKEKICASNHPNCGRERVTIPYENRTRVFGFLFHPSPVQDLCIQNTFDDLL